MHSEEIGARRFFFNKDTIFALASGKLPSSVAIYRISGKDSFAWVKRYIQVHSPIDFSKRSMIYASIEDDQHQLIDKSILLLVFPKPNSYTGEDVVEIQCHGSIAITRAVEELIVQFGIRPAEPGEFSYRAFLHNKMDFFDLEDLRDLFIAQEKIDLKSIYKRKEKNLEEEWRGIKEKLIQLISILDTSIDFSEEYSDVCRLSNELVSQIIHACHEILNRYERFIIQGKHVPRLCLFGEPNVGKSSLFNFIVGRERAIVHEQAGTTRDVIEEDISLGKRQWRIVDTAGLRTTDEDVEKIGINFTMDQMASSSLSLLLLDGSRIVDTTKTLSLYKKLKEYSKNVYIVNNKKDKTTWRCLDRAFVEKENLLPIFNISIQTKEGIDAFLEFISDVAEKSFEDLRPLPRAKELAQVKAVVRHLVDMQSKIEKNYPPEYISEDARLIASLFYGTLDPIKEDDILEQIFSSFCIGK